MVEPENFGRIGTEAIFKFCEDGVDFGKRDRFSEAVVDLHA